jgi:hypothetical protein
MKSLLPLLLFTLFLSGCSLEFKKQLKAVEEILIANGKNPKLARAISRTVDNKNVFSVNLQNDSLRIIPDAIGRLPQLHRLLLNFNKIEEISEEIGKCTALVMIELVGNRLKRLPESIGNLRNLEILELRANQLEYLPESIGKLQKLGTLTLQRNQIKELPESFGDLRIGTVWLNENKLTTLPQSFGRLRANEISLDDNLFTTFPSKQILPIYRNSSYFVGLSGNKIDPSTVPDIFKEKCSMWKDGIILTSRNKDSVLHICHNPIDESKLVLSTE